jgi:hypothetical protein
MAPIELVRSFLEQASGRWSRSTALQPLGWLLGIVLSVLLFSLATNPPAYVIYILLTFAGIILLTYIGAYLYFMIRLPDALRSEKYTLSKMAIERSVTGDNLAGFLEPDQRPLLLPAVEPKASDK